MSNQLVSLVTGAGGQCGSYLAEQLVERGDKVYCILRRSSLMRIDNLENIADKITICYGDVVDQSNIINLLNTIKPDRIYHLASQSHVPTSFDVPAATFESVTSSLLYLLEAIRLNPELRNKTRIYNSNSSEIFGGVTEIQDEGTPLYPKSPYGVSKAAAHLLMRNYRESYGIYGVSGICFNMESPRRSANFVTKKIALAAARIKLGLQNELRLGNIYARRDWIAAFEATRMMALMLEQDIPEDFVIGSGVNHSVEDFAKLAFEEVGLNYKDYLVIDAAFNRPAEVQNLRANPSKAKAKLGWVPQTSFEDLVRMMVQYDLENCARESTNMRVTRQSVGSTFGG